MKKFSALTVEKTISKSSSVHFHALFQVKVPQQLPGAQPVQVTTVLSVNENKSVKICR